MADIIENQDGSITAKNNLHAIDNTARTLGVIGTAISGLGILGMGLGGSKLFGGSSTSSASTVNNGGGSDMTSEANAMTSENLYIERKQAQNYIDITKQYYEGQISNINELNNRFNETYQRDIDNSFQLYKYTRDSNDDLQSKIEAVDKKVDVMAAIRPYQDALIDSKINTNAILAQYALDKRTCRMVEGQLVLPSTPTVTGYGSYVTYPTIS